MITSAEHPGMEPFIANCASCESTTTLDFRCRNCLQITMYYPPEICNEAPSTRSQQSQFRPAPLQSSPRNLLSHAWPPQAPLLSLKTLRSIKFVQFENSRSDLLDIQKQDDLTPADLKDVYRYNLVPADKISPVGANHMLNLCIPLECADEAGILFDGTPKKLKERLSVCPQKVSSLR